MKPFEAVTKAVEASIAWHDDELTDTPDWSMNPHTFWMALSEYGYEVVPSPKRLDDDPVETHNQRRARLMAEEYDHLRGLDNDGGIADA